METVYLDTLEERDREEKKNVSVGRLRQILGTYFGDAYATMVTERTEDFGLKCTKEYPTGFAGVKACFINNPRLGLARQFGKKVYFFTPAYVRVNGHSVPDSQLYACEVHNDGDVTRFLETHYPADKWSCDIQKKIHIDRTAADNRAEAKRCAENKLRIALRTYVSEVKAELSWMPQDVINNAMSNALYDYSRSVRETYASSQFDASDSVLQTMERVVGFLGTQ